MARKNYKDNRIEIVDPVRVHIEEAQARLLNDLINKDAEFAADVMSDKQHWAERSVSDKVDAEKAREIEEARAIQKQLKEASHNEAISGVW